MATVTGTKWVYAFEEGGRDMRDLPWPARFDGAYCFGNSFGYLDDVGNEAFLRSVAASLKPGGTFVLETPMVAESAWLTVKERPWWKVGDIHLLVVNRFDHARGRLDTEYTFVSGGGVEVRHGTHRVYTYRQLVDLLTVAGFSNVVGLTRASGHAPDPLAGAGAMLEPYRMGAATLQARLTGELLRLQQQLDDNPVLWGGPISDERYLVLG